MSLKVDHLGNKATYPYAFLTEKEIEELSSKHSDIEILDLLTKQEEIPLIDLF